MEPPIDSISLAICSAVRAVVPCKSIFAMSSVTPLFVRIFREHAAAQHGADFHEGQAMVFLHEQAQAVRQFNFLNRIRLLRARR